MTSNSQAIIQDVRADFEKKLEYVAGEAARQATADATERGLFKMLIEMGLKLLTLLFAMRSEHANRETLRMPDGSASDYHDKISQSKPSKPQNKHLWATLDGKEAALSRLSTQVQLRLGKHLRHKIALCDGCPSLQARLAKYFSGFIQFWILSTPTNISGRWLMPYSVKLTSADVSG